MRSGKKRVTPRVESPKTFVRRSSERLSRRRIIASEDCNTTTKPKTRTTRRNERKKTAVPDSSQRVSKRLAASRKRREPPEEPEVYKHQPLDTHVDEIRLLKLRRDNEGPVHCEVNVFRLEDAPPYIALSYRWGPPSPVHNVLIEGKALKIRDILNSCLLELREDVDTWLWIDQICIAQTDTSERNHQVGMMSRIYSSSTSVAVWLGDIPLAYPREDDRFNDQDLDQESMLLLFKNQYFTRTWIIQEVALAKRIKLHINGHRSITWSTLYKTYKRSRDQHIFADPLLRNLVFWVFHPEKIFEDMSLGLIIVLLSNSACQDPRDKVYGLMALVRKEDRLKVDYGKSVSRVYFDAIMKVAECKVSRLFVSSVIHELGRGMGVSESLIRDLELWLPEVLAVLGIASEHSFVYLRNISLREPVRSDR